MKHRHLYYVKQYLRKNVNTYIYIRSSTKKLYNDYTMNLSDMTRCFNIFDNDIHVRGLINVTLASKKIMVNSANFLLP